MILVKNLYQIHSLSLTNFCLYFRTEGVLFFEHWYLSRHALSRTAPEKVFNQLNFIQAVKIMVSLKEE